MKLRMIWTMPAMTLKERLLRTREWGAQKIARMLPLRIRYWVTIHALAKASVDSDEVPATTLDVILKNLHHPKNVH